MREAASLYSFYFSCSSLASLISSIFHYVTRALSQDFQDKEKVSKSADGDQNMSFSFLTRSTDKNLGLRHFSFSQSILTGYQVLLIVTQSVFRASVSSFNFQYLLVSVRSPVAAYFFFLFIPSLPYFLQYRVLEGKP